MEANLLVTYNPSHPNRAMEEVRTLLSEIGEETKFTYSSVMGVFFINVKNAKKSIKELHKMAEKRSVFEFTFRWIPIEKWCKTSIKIICTEMKYINERLSDKDSWKLDLIKRQYTKHRTPELIQKLTEYIDKPKVDLKNPKKIIRIDIIGDKTGISLLDASEFLDAQKIKK